MVNFCFVTPTLAGGAGVMHPFIRDQVTNNANYEFYTPAGKLEGLTNSTHPNVIKAGNFINGNSGFGYSEPRQIYETCSNRGLNVNK